MKLDIGFLLAAPVLIFGLIPLVLVALVLLLLRNRRRLYVGIAGYAAGYFVLGTTFADQLGEEAARRGACADAAWLGPAKGGLWGCVVAVVVFEVIRVVMKLRCPRAA